MLKTLKMSNFYVYFHYRLSDNILFYIGKGKGRRAYVSTKRNKHWKNTVEKHGFRIEFVDTGLSEEDAFDLECFCISFFRDKAKLTNMTTGGEGFSGGKHSIESKSKIVEALRKRVVSEETRSKLSRINTGKKLSQSHIEKLVKVKLGKNKGLLNPFSDKTKHKFIRVSDNFSVYCTRAELCEQFNLTSDHVKKLFAKKPRKTSKGWRLADAT